MAADAIRRGRAPADVWAWIARSTPFWRRRGRAQRLGANDPV